MLLSGDAFALCVNEPNLFTCRTPKMFSISCMCMCLCLYMEGNRMKLSKMNRTITVRQDQFSISLVSLLDQESNYSVPGQVRICCTCIHSSIHSLWMCACVQTQVFMCVFVHETSEFGTSLNFVIKITFLA